ncbi:MAG TPA: IS1182 family transposase [Prolixibacteraceae bacterium]|nr:IS1182 family transposase [Prolixibacteraceae bacterium]
MRYRSNIKFKEVTSQQTVLFPSNIGDRIPDNHPVRLVNSIVDQLNIDRILELYKGGGTSSYHPRIMLKILFYSYFNNIQSCRKIEKMLHENIYFMWISGNNTPDFRTINYFRSKRLKDIIQDLFAEMVRLMADLGYVSLEKQYIDGTKIEAASNRYTFVWRGSSEKNKAKLEEKIKLVLSEIESAIKQDDQVNSSGNEIGNIDSKELKKRIEELNQRLDKLNKKQQKNVEKLEKEHLPKLKEYENQLNILGERKSYSKTDPDATFMRMKEDHMKNGQLKPGYNVQISTENQIITNYTMHQRPGDTATLKPHLEQFEQQQGKQSKQVIADSGYGSEENYEYAQNKGIEAFIKYNWFHKEQKRKYKNDPFLPANLFYNAESDFLVCPTGQKMHCVSVQKRTSDLGYLSTVHIYQAINCNGCPMRGSCHEGKGNRRIEINHKLRRYRAQARERLMSEQGLEHRSMRPIEPEAVFGQIKFNNKFNRFTLRGLEKVNVEFGLVAISHNLRKIVSRISGLSAKKDIYAFCIEKLWHMLDVLETIMRNEIPSETKNRLNINMAYQN